MEVLVWDDYATCCVNGIRRDRVQPQETDASRMKRHLSLYLRFNLLTFGHADRCSHFSRCIIAIDVKSILFGM